MMSSRLFAVAILAASPFSSFAAAQERPAPQGVGAGAGGLTAAPVDAGTGLGTDHRDRDPGYSTKSPDDPPKAGERSLLPSGDTPAQAE